MASVKQIKLEAKLTVTLELSEVEARALAGIFGYSVEAFLTVFYQQMGRAYVQPHEEGVRSLHSTILSAVNGPLAEADKARRAISSAISTNH